MKNHRQMYQHLFDMEFRALYLRHAGTMSKDKATRLANIYASKYTHAWWKAQYTKEPVYLLRTE